MHVLARKRHPPVNQRYIDGLTLVTTVPISDDYQITTDPYQWIVQKRRRRTKKGHLVDEWEAVAFYPTFQSAFVSLGESMVRRSNASGYAEAYAELKRVLTTLSHALTRAIETTQPSPQEVNDGR